LGRDCASSLYREGWPGLKPAWETLRRTPQVQKGKRLVSLSAAKVGGVEIGTLKNPSIRVAPRELSSLASWQGRGLFIVVI